MKCLVTGAAGFIGSHLCERLIKEGCEVVGIDNFMDYYARSFKESNISGLLLDPGFRFVEESILDCDLGKLFEDLDAVFHQSAQAGVRASWGANFRIYSDNNILATQMLLEAAKSSPVKKFIYASSSSVYGDTTDLPMRESSVTRPVSPYGVSKMAAEHLCYLYYRNFRVPTVSLRYFTVYGPRQRPDMAFHRFFKWILEGKVIQMYGDGEQSRDFTHVDDIVGANWLAFEKGDPGRVFNIGGGSTVTMNQVIHTMEEITGRPATVDYQQMQKGDVRHTSADMTMAREELGYNPAVSIRKGLETEYKWIRELMDQTRGR
ncbi:MAG: UDP-glucose 4-epimerase [Desulfobacterales bacterium C00003104]|nr:MAG: UDP-glucose 4-epimerase [Desulfobacterales bacterium C00003104]